MKPEVKPLCNAHVDVDVDVDVRTYEELRASRADSCEKPLNGGDAGILWSEYSPFPKEAGIAGRRYKDIAPRYIDSWALLMAVAEAAFEGHHAAGACVEEYLRSRAVRIRETVHAEMKATGTHPDRVTRPLHKPNWSL